MGCETKPKTPSHPPSLFSHPPKSHLHSFFPNSSASFPCPGSQGWMGGYDQSITAPLCCSSLLTLFPCFCMGPSHGLQVFRRTCLFCMDSSMGQGVDICFSLLPSVGWGKPLLQHSLFQSFHHRATTAPVLGAPPLLLLTLPRSCHKPNTLHKARSATKGMTRLKPYQPILTSWFQSNRN